MRPEPEPRRYEPAPPVGPENHGERYPDEQYVRHPAREEVVRESTEDSYASRVKGVRVATSVIHFITGLFALVLAIQIVLVLAEANPGNGFASFIGGFAGAVNLGFDGLFSPGSEKAAVFFNYGAAALLWLAIGAGLAYLVRRFAMPGPNRTVSRRRTVY